jgi:hypothetical protein
MINANIYAAWLGMLAGGLAGAALGLFFHRESWLGGYGSWRRRMLRLGHISLFGLALVNLAFAFSASQLGIAGEVLLWPSRLLIVGLVTMPLVCYLSAFVTRFRHLFFVPVLSVITATVLFLWVLVAR